MDKITFNKKAKVYITEKLQAQVTMMHSQCPSNKEWSGLLVYKITGGTIPEFLHGNGELELTCEDFFLMDLGDATFTSFEGSGDWLTFFEQFPHVDPTREDKNNNYYIGKLHSHHNMPAFHSETDTQDLLENAPKLPMFLSLVVNYACNPFAEVAISYEIEEKWTFKKWMEGVFKDNVHNKTGNIVIPCEIYYNGEPALIKQIEEVKQRAKSAATTYSYNTPSNTKKGEQKTIGFDYEEWKKKNKKTEKDLKMGTKVYTKVMACLSDLLLLGHVDKNVPAFKALSDADDYVTMQNLGTYSKAFKEYFDMYWFDSNFFNTVHTREDVIESVKEFCEIQSQVWLARELTKILNELKDEVSVLRAV